MIFQLINCNLNHNFIFQINQESKMKNSDQFTNIVKYGVYVQIPKIQSVIIKQAIILHISLHQVKIKHAEYSSMIIRKKKIKLKACKY